MKCVVLNDSCLVNLPLLTSHVSLSRQKCARVFIPYRPRPHATPPLQYRQENILTRVHDLDTRILSSSITRNRNRFTIKMVIQIMTFARGP